jgi:pimeloyl-ACP methyl ester carboxylesterase
MEGLRTLIAGVRVRDPYAIEGEDGVPVVGTFLDGERPSGVVLVHGIVGSRRMAEIVKVARHLAAEHDVLSIDALGHGDAAGRFTWGREEWRGVAAAARHLKESGRRVAVVGFSFGGYHAARAAGAGAPIDRLVLVGAPVDLKVLDHFPLGLDFWRHAPAMLRRRRRLPRVEWRFPVRRSALARDELARIPVATLVIRGSADFLITKRHAERYVREIPDARLLEIPGGLHAEYLVASSPDAILGAIGEFLSR